MKVLIRQATILSPSSPHHGKVMDILVGNGIILNISPHITEKADKEIASPALFASEGWVDTFADFTDPGQEYKETLDSGALAAAAGGFTDVMVVPDTTPVVSSKSQVEYVMGRSHQLPAGIHPIGSVTRNAEGKELAEMYDMHNAGAVAFSDGKSAVQSSGVMLKALQYMLAINGTIIQLPDDKSIGTHGLMNEGVTSTLLGLPGKPAIAEELMIHRDIELLRYTGSRLHITGLSTKKGLDLVKAAQKEGLNITCSVTPFHCYFNEEDLTTYDTNLKVNPPLRTKEDMHALRQSVIKGEVGVASHHRPQHWDDKTCEFEYAKNGMISLQTVYPVLSSLGVKPEVAAEILANKPRAVFGIPHTPIIEGQEVSITLFDPNENFTFTAECNKSLSRNSPFFNMQFTGRVIGTLRKNQYYLNENQ